MYFFYKEGLEGVLSLHRTLRDNNYQYLIITITHITSLRTKYVEEIELPNSKSFTFTIQYIKNAKLLLQNEI